ncbi:MAG: L-lactate permease [Verrucomicrobiaceae bacterium]|nr:L-lactate permease [Verrucomicrobiaceae bacterium]
MTSLWLQQYDPLHSQVLSTAVAALPVVALMSLIAWGKTSVHRSATAALVLATGIAVFVFGMPVSAAGMAAVNGALYGLLPIGWMVINIIFLHRMTVEKGWFDILKTQLAAVAPDPRVQVVLIAFCFGAFFEGTAGFGSPVAVTSALLMQLGFRPLQACGLSLIANTAPVAFGGMGTPLIALNAVTGIDLMDLSRIAGTQLPLFSLIIPFWVVGAYSGWQGIRGVWPVALTAGLSFAIPQFLVSRFHGPWLVDVIASLCSMAAVVVLLRYWRPAGSEASPRTDFTLRCWVPWLILCVVVFVWGVTKTRLDTVWTSEWKIPFLHEAVQRTAPIAPVGATAESAVLKLNLISTTGTGIFLAAILAGFFMGFSPVQMAKLYLQNIVRLRVSLVTISAMLALGYVTKFSGMDATLGLALAGTGWYYPFFGALLGWLGVALTGSDTASNVLFGSLQTITAKQVGVDPALMAAANSTGGVMGKMIDAQSIVVASAATQWQGHEGSILRFVFWHSIILACLVGLFVMMQAYL